MRLSAIALLAPLACVASLGGWHFRASHASDLPYYRTAFLEPEWLSDAAASAPTMHHVAPFTMTDQQAARVTERALAGHVTIVQFFFTKCGDICPTTTRNIARALDLLGAEPRLQVLSYSVAADKDSVAALRMYATMHHIADPRWHLLTGPRDLVERLARESYFTRLGDGTTYGVATIAHTESVFLVDGDGRLRGIYAGSLTLDMDRLVEDARLLLRH